MKRGWLRRFLPSTYRLVVICVIIGVFGAGAALVFDSLVELSQEHLLQGMTGYTPPPAGVLEPAAQFPEPSALWWIPVVTGLGGLLGGCLVYFLAPEAEGHGTDAAVAAYHHRGGAVRVRVPPIKAVASALTIGSGGVAGREGPTAQIAVGLGALTASWFRLRGQERRIILLASMAGGLAAVFRAPLGMAIFAVEILYAGMVFESEALIYTVIAAVTAYAVHGFFVGWSPMFAIPGGLAFDNPATLLAYGALGVFAGLVGAMLPTIFYGIRDLFRRFPGPPHFKPAIGGICVGLIGMAFPAVLGTGYGWLELAMTGQLSLLMMGLILALKVPAMGLTIGSGGSGGVFGPTVVIGGMLGGLFGGVVNQLFPMLELSIAATVLVGMAATFAGAARTPISTLIMVAEMTGGYALIVPSMLANVLSFMVQRSLTAGLKYPTLYVSQVFAREDSPVHKGILVRRALRLLEAGEVDAADITMPRLVSLLQYGEPVQVSPAGGMLVSVQIRPNSRLDGRTIAESLGSIQGITAVAVIRGPELVVPRGPTRLQTGDQLIAIADPAAYGEIQALAGASPAG
jgi:chloride channel protein, CIC family